MRLNAPTIILSLALAVPAAHAQNASQQQNRDMPRQEGQQQGGPQKQQPAGEIEAEQMIGRAVYDQQDELLGVVDDIHVKEDGLGHIILRASQKGQEQYYLVPWQKIEQKQDQLVLQADRDQLQQAPYLTERDFNDDWIERSYTYWGYVNNPSK